MKKALGLIETRGLVAAIAAADKALKSAHVILEGKEITEPGYVTIRFTGDLTEIQIAVAAGSEAARDTGELISSIVIADPDTQLSILLGVEKGMQKRDFIGSFPPAPLEIYNASPAPVSEEVKRVSPEKKKILDEAGNGKNELIVKKSKPVKLKEEIKSSVTSPISKEIPEKIFKSDTSETLELTSPVKEVLHKENIKKDIPILKRNNDHQKKEEVLDTITRLRMEALGKKPESRRESVTVSEAAGQDLVELNVHQLRKLARNTPDFPIFGRKISKANREELLKLFNGIKN